MLIKYCPNNFIRQLLREILFIPRKIDKLITCAEGILAAATFITIISIIIVIMNVDLAFPAETAPVQLQNRPQNCIPVHH